MKRVIMLLLVAAPVLVCGGEPAKETVKEPIRSSTEKVFEKEEPKADKSGYHLFKPVPKELMREMSTDRPDQTESPYTVDAGHFQIEWDLFNFVRERNTPGGGSEHTDTYTLGATNFKMGLTHVITLCAEEVCPTIPVKVSRLPWGLPDPAAVKGSEEERLAAFRKIRDEIRRRLEDFKRSTNL